MQYLENLMQNGCGCVDSPLSESVLGIIQQNGGKNSSVPSGSFPPIYLCTKKVKEKKMSREEKQTRKYKSHIKTVSIKEIMKTRRNITPFLSL
jgi:hypothetical protein